MFTPAPSRRGNGEGHCLPRSLHIALISLIAFVVTTSVQESDAKVVAQGEGVTVAITPSGAAGGAAGEMTGVVLEIEITEPDAVELYGYQSMNSVVDIDCPGARDRVRRAQAFQLPHLAGPSQERHTSGQWVRPSPGAFMADVIAKACASAGLRSTSPQLAAAVPSAPSTKPAAVRSAPPTQPIAPSHLSPSPSTSTSPTAPSKPTGGAARLRAQIASSTNEHAAREVLEKIGSRISPQLTTDVETAQVRGKTVYRSVVAGFASEAEAQSFCAQMKQASVACIVWKGQQ